MLEFQVGSRSVTSGGDAIFVSGSARIYKCHFTFSDEWEGLSVRACFENGDTKVGVLLTNDNECYIPWEVLERPGKVTVGVVGVNSDGVIRVTMEHTVGNVHMGSDTNVEINERERTQSLIDQIQSAFGDFYNAERKRVFDEEARAESEISRVKEEYDRYVAELERKQLEIDRAEAENLRKEDELYRVQSELARTASENERALAENVRVQQEQSRDQAESHRSTAEMARYSSEQARVSAENQRVHADEQRTDGYIAAKAAYETALQTLQDSLASGDLKGEPGNDGLAGKDGESGVYYGTEEPAGENHPIWINPDGSPNDYTGERGATGENGYTPVRGVDYWTEEDKAVIVSAVIDSLPDASEVEY